MSTAIQKDDLKKFMGKVEARENTWQNLLPDGLKASWFVGEVRVAVARAPNLLNCNEVSVFDALTTCAQLGLSPSGRLGSAYLIPFKDKCTLVIGYRGYQDLAYRSGDVESFHAEVVYAKDDFLHEEGLSPVLRHKRCEDDKPGDLRAVYAIAKMKGGGTSHVVMYRREVLAIKARSRSSGSGPWATDEAEMYKKTAIRRLIKSLPLSPTRAKALFAAEQVEREQEEALDVDFVVQSDEPTTGVAGAKAALKNRNSAPNVDSSFEPDDAQKAAILAAEQEAT